MIGDKYFLVIPVYRLNESKYYSDMKKHLKKNYAGIMGEEV